jgi:hypothetical protein
MTSSSPAASAAPRSGKLAQVFQSARLHRAALARQSLLAFVRFVGMDEQTNQPLQLAPFQEEMLELVQLHPRLAIRAFLEAGKSQLLSILTTLWLLGRNPALRVILVSNTFGQSQKLLRAIAHYVENSTELHLVFPHMRKGPLWREDSLSIARGGFAKDPSVQCTGAHGPVLGSRCDHLVLDDVDDWESTRTEQQRDALWQWVNHTLMSRLTADGRVIAVATAHHKDDLVGRLSRHVAWTFRRFAILDDSGRSIWEARWPWPRIQQKNVELGAEEFNRQMMANDRDDASAVFRQEWIDRAVAQGANFRTTLARGTLQGRCLTGCDMGISQKPGSDLSALVTILVTPQGRRHLLGIESGRWTGNELMGRIVNCHKRYGSTVILETVAAQAFIQQFLRDQGEIPASQLVGFKTGAGAMSLPYQATALAAELERGDWVLPAAEPMNSEVAALCRDLLNYSPQGHCPDRLAALLIADWGARQAEQKAEFFYWDIRSR